MQGTRIKREQFDEPLEVAALASLDIHPKKVALAEPRNALLVEIDFLVVSVRIVQIGVNHGAPEG